MYSVYFYCITSNACDFVRIKNLMYKKFTYIGYSTQLILGHMKKYFLDTDHL